MLRVRWCTQPKEAAAAGPPCQRQRRAGKCAPPSTTSLARPRRRIKLFIRTIGLARPKRKIGMPIPPATCIIYVPVG